VTPARATATLAFTAVLGAACSRDQPRRGSEQTPAAVAPPAPAAAAAAGCQLADVPARRPAASRVVAIGDLHGDLAAARAALRAGGVIDAKDAWTGGTTVVVQTGDILDRGDDEQAIIDLFERLETEAAAAGGAVVWLLGNHELMNAAGDLRYVTRGGYADFEDVPGLEAIDTAATAALADVPERARARVAAFRPGGPYARILAGQNTVAIVGDTVFAHGGLHGPWAGRFDEINRSDRCWLAGTGDPPAAAEADDGPVWTRAYGAPEADCDAARAALTELGVRRMVVGHTPQPSGITSACDATIWRIDVGLARYYDGPIEVLELIPGAEPRVLRGQRL
jgi:hypothetical protein